MLVKAEIKNIEREIKITLNFIEEAIISLIKTAAIIKRKLGYMSRKELTHYQKY